MASVYAIGENSMTQTLVRVHCKDEEKELQDLLFHNPHLLPSDQIDPENPPRWLLIKREIPVRNPASGTDWWSLDFLYVDHTGTLTLVECKRCNDTRSRREVIAQMIEYAANGQHYWSQEELKQHALMTAGGEEALKKWVIEQNWESIDAFFAFAVEKLKKSQVRLVFFLENSPNELRSLVDFLNRQLNETEVFLVEARLYETSSGRIVVPWLFGYTEEARVAKAESRTSTARERTDKSEAAFRAAINAAALPPEDMAAVEQLIGHFSTQPGERPYWSWGANAILVIPSVFKTRGLFSIRRSGSIELYFGYWDPQKNPNLTEQQKVVGRRFASELSRILEITFSDYQLLNFPSVKPEVWAKRLPAIITMLDSLVEIDLPPE
jgi:hypothetical protein